MKKFFFILFSFFFLSNLFSENLNYLLDIKYRDFPKKKFVRIVFYFTSLPLFQEIRLKDKNKLLVTLDNTDMRNFYGNLKVPSTIIDSFDTLQKKNSLVVTINFKSYIDRFTTIKSKKPPLLYLKVFVTNVKPIEKPSYKLSENNTVSGNVTVTGNNTIKQLKTPEEILKKVKKKKKPVPKKEKIIKVKDIVTKAQINKMRNIYEQGLSLMVEKRYSDAIQVFNSILATAKKNNPYYIKSRFRILDCYYSMLKPNDFHGLMNLAYSYQDLIAAYPKSDEAAWAAFQMANCYERLGFLEEALGSFRFVTKYYPKSTFAETAFLHLSDILYKMKKYKEALQNYKKIILKYPKSILSIKANYYIGNCLYHLKKYKNALNVFTEAMKKAPEYLNHDAETLYNIGNTYFYLKKYPYAREYFLKIRNLFPKSPFFDLALMKIGETYVQEKDFKSALYVFKRVVDVSKDKEKIIIARLELADIGMSKKIKDKNLIKQYYNYINPEIAYNYIIKHFPKNKLTQIAFSGIVKYFLDNQRFQSAVDYLEEFFKRFPNSKIKDNMNKKMYDALYGLIDKSFKNKDYTKIIYYFEKYKKLYFKDLKPLKIFKDILFSYKNLGLSVAEKELLKRLLAKYKKDEDLNFENILINIKNNNFKKAVLNIENFNKEFKKSKYKKQLKFLKGFCFEKLTYFKEALNIFFDILDNNPVNKSKILYHIAETYKNSGNFQDALKFYTLITENINQEHIDKNIQKDSYFYKGYMNYLLKKYKDAVISLEDFVRLYPEDYRVDEAYYYIIDSYFNSSNYSKAKKYFEKVKTTFRNKNFLKLSKKIIENIDWINSFNDYGK